MSMLLKYEKEGGVVSHDTYNYILRTFIAHTTAAPAPAEGAEAQAAPAPLSSSFGTLHSAAQPHCVKGWWGKCKCWLIKSPGPMCTRLSKSSMCSLQHRTSAVPSQQSSVLSRQTFLVCLWDYLYISPSLFNRCPATLRDRHDEHRWS